MNACLHSLICPVIHSFIDYLIHSWPIDCLTCFDFIHWLIDGLIDWLINWLIVSLIDCLLDWLIDCLIVWLIDCLINWLIICLIVLVFGPGALGAPGPKLQDTHGECNYLLSGKLPTVRQTTYCQSLGPLHMESLTTYCQAGYLLSGRLSAAVRDAPNNRIHAPKSFRILCTQQPHTCTQPLHRHAPKSAYMHPRVAAYMHPNCANFNNLWKGYRGNRIVF